MANRPGFYQSGITKDIRDDVSSGVITASQLLTTVTASAGIFSAQDVDRVLKFLTGELAIVTAFISPTIVSVSPSQTVGSTTFIIRGHTLGGNVGESFACSSTGVIVGREQSIDNAEDHVFWFDTVADDFRDLGFETDSTLVAIDVADDGFALLESNPGFTGNRSQLYNPIAETFTDLGVLPGGTQTTPVKINSSHQCAVSCVVGPLVKAARWTAGVLTSVHPAADAGAETSLPIGINLSGQIVGSFFHPVHLVFRTFFNNGLGGEANSADIGSLSANKETSGTAINNAGKIVGTTKVGAQFVPFLWEPGFGMSAIPLLPGTVSGTARGINNNDWIVGEMDGIAFLFHDGVTHSLVDLIVLAPEWTALLSADFINDSNQVVGYGFRSALLKGYILSL